jgi:hypothetical protein
MKKIYILLVIISLVFHSSILHAQENFYKSFSIDPFGTSNSKIVDVINTYNNGFAYMLLSGGIIVTDSALNIKFYKKLFNDSTNIYFDLNIIQTTDSGYIIGTICYPFANNKLGCVVKFDKNGYYMWSKSYYHPTISSNTIGSIISSDNNGFYMVAGGCVGGPVLLKCDQLGNIIWQKKINTSNTVLKIVKYSVGKYIIYGEHVYSDYLGKLSVSLVDTSGNFLWVKEYDNSEVNFPVEAHKTSNNEISLLVNLRGINYQNRNATVHIDSLGNFLWAKKNQTTDSTAHFELKAFTETSDNGYLYTGVMKFPSTSYYRIVYMKTDFENNIEWIRHFTSINQVLCTYNEGVKVLSKNEKNFVFCNNCDGLSIAKLDKFGYGFCNIDSTTFNTENISYSVSSQNVNTINEDFFSENNYFNFQNVEVNLINYCTDFHLFIEDEIYNDFNLYPNPAKESLSIEMSAFIKDASISIYNLEGQIILQQPIHQSKSTFDISGLTQGLYLIKLITSEGIVVKKFIKE